jgi:hypothetical protein
MKNVVLLLAAWLLGLSAVEAQKHSLTASDLHKRDGLSETRGEEAEPAESLYGEWWLVGWNDIDNNRFANLREQYPNMQEDDIRLCILTRLGISNRTIGNIYCITISAVQHRKLKLKKDVFGETNPDITLEEILKK